MERIIWALVLVLVFGVWGTAVFAHGGGKIQLANQQVGECQSTVWLNPPEPRANEVLHITVGISDVNQAPVLSSEVEVLIVQDGRIIASDFAKTENSVNRLFYEVDFEPQQVGEYEIQLAYGDQGCSGDLSFPMRVSSTLVHTILCVRSICSSGGLFCFANCAARALSHADSSETS